MPTSRTCLLIYYVSHVANGHMLNRYVYFLHELYIFNIQDILQPYQFKHKVFPNDVNGPVIVSDCKEIKTINFMRTNPIFLIILYSM